MNVLQDWSGPTLSYLQSFGQEFLNFIPKLIGAIIIFVIGWLVSIWIGKLVAEILRRIKFDSIFEKTKWEEALKKAEFKMAMSSFIGAIIKWILVIVFLSAAVEILGMTQFSSFINDIVSWLPNLMVAVAMFVVAVIAADFFEKLAKAITGKMSIKYVNLVGSAVKWAIWIFAGLAILGQLGVAKEIIQIVITGFVALLVISCSLSFGLGGKDLARELLENLKIRFKD